MKILNWLCAALAVCLALGVGLGFAGAIHPLFDSLSLLRLPLAALCLLALVFPMRRRLRMIMASAAVVGLATTVPLFVGKDTDPGLRIYSKNIWYRNSALSALEADIRDSSADVVTLQEVSRANRALLVSLQDDYPYQHLCTFSGWSGIAVLSRQPIGETTCSTRRGAAAAEIETEAGRFWAVSVHLSWPFPYSNATTAAAVVDLMADLDGPIVMAGDFNIFPWAGSVQRMQDVASLSTARPIRPTYDLQGVPLLLDHVHAPGGGKASYRPLLGSDHLGVLADVSLTR